MKFTIAGVTYERVDFDRMTFAEVDAIERVTGMTMTQMDRAQITCVCGHYLKAHPAGGCASCGCPEFLGSAPYRVNAAVMWVSMKRTNPTLTYAAAESFEQGDITVEPEDEPLDPPAPAPAGSEPNGTGG